ncbi:MAG: Type I restriction-modification system, DNA adenine N6-methyltransferase subunit [Parcubacteria group bacterium GW2011_GWB1_41_6]|nr:MAG: Type I restriction-modification system, DNA adenine N6-methyltransferase subunit [Parcubacteria group bacterium GW2011_GWB1_41_6]KKS34707.1 MAG: Type I restriction-modification system, DNA adenine N6-methyltransferase subunit [Parcubacteria group bacterium GW2011_GWC2_42_13]KKS58297.1 MAG: Type I restriction-modification system, DNA adenine N6-methyltransferase subunit [Parcubacteria group bacterium GW2011_GWA2_42_35]KKS73318.1 MAG: Type I restriction-modification system, DNA adenine N6-
MSKKYLTIKEAAGLIGVTPLTLRNWDKKGKLAAIRHPINNYRVYDLSDLENFLGEIEARKPRKLKVKLIEE